MTEIRLLRDATIAGARMKAGDQVSVKNGRAAMLLESGFAELDGKAPPELVELIRERRTVLAARRDKRGFELATRLQLPGQAEEARATALPTAPTTRADWRKLVDQWAVEGNLSAP